MCIVAPTQSRWACTLVGIPIHPRLLRYSVEANSGPTTEACGKFKGTVNEFPLATCVMEPPPVKPTMEAAA
jgi:hypothetical protein